MLTYGLENFAIAPRANSSRKENSAPMTTTMPMRLIQLRKRESRVALGGDVSGIIQRRILKKNSKKLAAGRNHKPTGSQNHNQIISSNHGHRPRAPSLHHRSKCQTASSKFCHPGISSLT